MGLIDVRKDDEMDVMNDEVFVVDSDHRETRSVRCASSSTSTSSDDEAEKSPIDVRCNDGAELCRVRLGRRLGAGGFGRVYAGELEGTCCPVGRRVAVKVPRRRNCVSRGGAATSTEDSFLAESALVRLRHPNLVSVLAVGWISGHLLDDCGASTDSSSDDDAAVDMIPAVVMEFAGRVNLQSVVDDPSHSLSLRRRLK